MWHVVYDDRNIYNHNGNNNSDVILDETRQRERPCIYATISL